MKVNKSERAGLTDHDPINHDVIFVKGTLIKRIIASYLDGVVILISCITIYWLFEFSFHNLNIAYEQFLTFGPMISFLYCVLLEGTKYQRTVGKRIMNLKVIKASGEKMDLLTSLSRNVGKLLISFTFGQGLLKLLVPGELRAIQDEFAKCLVVKVVSNRQNAKI